MAARGPHADAVSTDLLNPMFTTPTAYPPSPGPRFARALELSMAGTGRRYALEGDARPGDVVALAGGAVVHDLNANGLADGVDVLAGLRSDRVMRGGLVDVRG